MTFNNLVRDTGRLARPAWSVYFETMSDPASPPPWTILQLDVTTRCGLRCPTCPQTAFSDNWRRADVSWDVVERLLPHAGQGPGRFGRAHLQGWGEPLLHPDLPRMVAAYTNAGTACGLTTNGMALTNELGRKLLDAGLASLTLSISGATPQTHDRLRPPSRLPDLLERIGRFKALAGRRCEVRLSFLQQPENIHELPEVVAIAARLKLDGVLGVNPSYLPTPEHAGRLATTEISAGPRARARRKAFFKRQQLTLIGEKPERLPCCENRPLENLCVDVDGRVSPCLFLQLPLAGGARPEKPTRTFGSVLDDGLDAIWDRPDYAAFRERFARRETAYQQAMSRVLGGMEEGGALATFKADLELLERDCPPPPECAGCLKLEGL